MKPALILYIKNKDKNKISKYRTIPLINTDAKKLKKNVSKSNLKQFKKIYTPQPSGTYTKFPRLVQHSKEKEISIIHYINRLKKEKHMMICTDIEAFEKIQC